MIFVRATVTLLSSASEHSLTHSSTESLSALKTTKLLGFLVQPL